MVRYILHSTNALLLKAYEDVYAFQRTISVPSIFSWYMVLIEKHEGEIQMDTFGEYTGYMPDSEQLQIYTYEEVCTFLREKRICHYQPPNKIMLSKGDIW